MSIVAGKFLHDMVGRYITNQDKEVEKRKAFYQADLIRERELVKRLEETSETKQRSSGPSIGTYFNAVLKK